MYVSTCLYACVSVCDLSFKDNEANLYVWGYIYLLGHSADCIHLGLHQEKYQNHPHGGAS